MQLATPERAADERWGYQFGVDGLVTISKAAELMACSVSTVLRLAADGKLRKGRMPDGRRITGICRRSLMDLIASMEQ